DILVQQRGDRADGVARGNRLEIEEQAILRFVEVAHERQEESHISIAAALHDRRWMLLRRGQVRTRLRTPDLHQPLRAAAHRADRLPERRAVPAGLALLTERTAVVGGHSYQFLTLGSACRGTNM